MTLPDAGALVSRDGAAISRLENLKTLKFRPEVVAHLLRGYGVPEPEVAAAVETVQQLAKAGKPGPGWYEEYGGAPAQFFEPFLELETEADTIDVWHPALWPGIVHTADYARHVIGSVLDDIATDEVERRVRLRLGRQSILEESPGPQLRIVVAESVLTRDVGGPDVVKAQLERVIELTMRPGIAVHVVPRSVGAHPGNFGGPITAFGFGDGGPDNTIVYLENYQGGTYLDLPEDTRSYLGILGAVHKHALSEDESRDTLTAAAAAV